MTAHTYDLQQISEVADTAPSANMMTTFDATFERFCIVNIFRISPVKIETRQNTYRSKDMMKVGASAQKNSVCFMLCCALLCRKANSEFEATKTIRYSEKHHMQR